MSQNDGLASYNYKILSNFYEKQSHSCETLNNVVRYSQNYDLLVVSRKFDSVNFSCIKMAEMGFHRFNKRSLLVENMSNNFLANLQVMTVFSPKA